MSLFNEIFSTLVENPSLAKDVYNRKPAEFCFTEGKAWFGVIKVSPQAEEILGDFRISKAKQQASPQPAESL